MTKTNLQYLSCEDSKGGDRHNRAFRRLKRKTEFTTTKQTKKKQRVTPTINTLEPLNKM